MAFPTTIPQRKLDLTANRLRDELGKGAEALRKFGTLKLTATATETRQIIGIPQVDIKIVSVQLVGQGATAVTAEVIAPAAYSDSPGSTNRLITAVPATSLTNNNIYFASLTSLAGRVKAGQPIIGVLTDTGAQAGTVEFLVSYVLADQNEVSYEVYNVTAGEQPADVSGFPGARKVYNRYQTARTIADELGKGHEVLRSFQTTVNVPTSTTTRAIVGVPDVDIKVVSIDMVGNGVADATDISVTAPATYTASVSDSNRLMSDLDSIAATGTITGDGTVVSNNDTVTINGTAYTFKSTMTPADGEVHIAGTAAATLTNLFRAINNSGGTPGTDYQVSGANADVTATNPTATTVVLTAKAAGSAGNALTLAKSATHLSLSGATLSGGSDNVASNAVTFATLTNNANRVKAFQPIIANITGGAAGAGVVTFIVRYLLADIAIEGAQDAILTYTNYGQNTDLSGAKTFGSARASRQLYASAFRLADELGKNQEVLRQFPAATIVTNNGGGVQRLIVGVPDVDIRITNISLVGEGLAASSVDVIAPATFTESVATNKLMSQLTATALVDDKVVHATLNGAATRVKAGQPIQLAVTDTGSQAGTVTAVVSYVLADEGYSSKSPVTYAQ